MESIQKAEQEIVETAFSKGIAFEQEFAQFMKTIGWPHHKIRPQMASNINMSGTNVDIMAKRHNELGEKAGMLAILYFGFFFILLAIGLISDDQDISDAMRILAPFCIIIGAIAFAASQKLIFEHAWVECKNRKTKATFEMVQGTLAAVQANKASDRNYKIVQVYFVSASGFVSNALKLAEDNNVICYQKKDGKFERVRYWEN